MNVNDISNGSEVKIFASISGHGIVLMTQAIFGVSAGLLVKPMEYFGKYMQLLEPSQVEIRNKRDGRVYKFMSTSIAPVKTRYGNFHLIRCSSKLEPENSRKAERFAIEKLGLFAVNGNTLNLKNCIVHDVSLRGISLIIDPSTKVKIGDQIDVKFRYGATLHSYELTTTVVRFFTVKERPAIGCSISNLNVDLISLLSAKKNEKYPPIEAVPEVNLNPEVSETQQIMEVEEDIAKQLIPEKPRGSRVSENPLDPANLEHIERKTLRQKNKEEKMAQQAKEIENLLDLRDI
ncbi:PilZ domain-containing protein [Butyrivibrio proteoclasticus]|uniref:PilZ domain-containing protein n=1 Tax=Butyrivibrio proteoclasticus TaxID=43305 RepID=UPI000478E392|nr:PilZ domain-containing protein [Butyrivibrio proteoclasticus]